MTRASKEESVSHIKAVSAILTSSKSPLLKSSPEQYAPFFESFVRLLMHDTWSVRSQALSLVERLLAQDSDHALASRLVRAFEQVVRSFSDRLPDAERDEKKADIPVPLPSVFAQVHISPMMMNLLPTVVFARVLTGFDVIV